MTAHTPSARQRTERMPLRTALPPLLGAALLSGVGAAVAVAVTPEAARVHMAWAAGTAAVLLCVATAVIAYQLQRYHLLNARLGETEAGVWRLAHDFLPELVTKLRAGAAPDTAMASVPRPEVEAHQQVMRTFAQELGRSEAGKSAAMSACADAAGRMQALSTGMLADLRDMEHRHADEAVLGDLLYLDHRTAQAGRLADSIAVLTGARSGRRWAKPIVMESILRGAMGRIAGYQRVRLHTTVDVSVAGHAAEGVMHALAELLDNAANFSPPTAEVHVYVEEVPAGLVITIEDSGLVMGDFALRRAERAVSGEPLDLTTLSGTRLGLAVVGCLARKHGLMVSFRPSARGGTGVIVRIPQELISRPNEGPQLTGQPAARYTPASQQPLDQIQEPAPQPQEAQPPAAPAPQAGSLFGSEPPASREPAAHAEADSAGVDGVGSGFPTELPKRRSALKSSASDQQPGAEARPDASAEHSRATHSGADQLYQEHQGALPTQGHDPLTDPLPSSGGFPMGTSGQGFGDQGFGEQHGSGAQLTGSQENFRTLPANRGDSVDSSASASFGETTEGVQRAEDVSPAQPAPTHDFFAPAVPPRGARFSSQETEGQSELGPSGLPKRRRGQTLAAAHSAGATPPRPAAPRRSAAESAARFGTFRRAVRGQNPDAGNAPDQAPEPSTPPAPPSSYSQSEDDVR